MTLNRGPKYYVYKAAAFVGTDRVEYKIRWPSLTVSALLAGLGRRVFRYRTAVIPSPSSRNLRHHRRKSSTALLTRPRSATLLVPTAMTPQGLQHLHLPCENTSPAKHHQYSIESYLDVGSCLRHCKAMKYFRCLAHYTTVDVNSNIKGNFICRLQDELAAPPVATETRRRLSYGGCTPPPPEFFCPISHCLMTEPVTLLNTGITFNRTSIQAWMRTGALSHPLPCPLTPKLVSLQLNQKDIQTCKQTQRHR